MNKFSSFVFVIALALSACSGSGPGSGGPISVTVSPTTASIDIGGTKQFTATVKGLPNSEVAWTISGAGCTGNACGTIDATGLYSAPDDPPSPSTFTVTATSQVDTTKSGSAGITVTSTSNAGLNGKYAFIFNGFELSNLAVAIAGSFTVDGNGGVTGGILDTNRTAGSQTVPVTGGTYSFGADNRGRLNLTTPQESLFFRFAMNPPNGPSHNGRMICFQPGDVSRLTGSGVIKKQSPAAFSMDAFNGNFAAGLSGELGSRNPVGAIGRFTLDGLAGTISSGAVDLNLTGSSYPDLAVSGTYSSINPMTGRGLARLSLPAPVGDMNFSFYIVSAGEAFFVAVDARSPTRPLLSGPALKQSGGPFALGSMAGPLVLNATGLNASGSDVTIGRFDANAATGNVSGVLDENAAGAINANMTFTGVYDIAANGRGTLISQIASISVPYAFYMVAPNRAFLVQSEAPEAGVGFIEAQTGGPFTTASLSGNYVVGTATPAECGCTSISGVVTLDGNGSFLGARDKSKPDGLYPRDTWAGTLEVLSGTNGRGTLTATAPLFESSVLYVISPNKVVLINAEASFHVSVVTILEK